ncbi:hypothetical protein CAMRE0001_1137 [Campylobacter rectus RM3267]|uniref:Uncharacterized protein n=2 Tax=Campylobacter rectus TaxID=203 RepID=A0A6G5QLE0_CAMRE|nr:hypothetical protein CAMRE0001_1137 [Campylobacter rectus RM3267]QCD46296.1 hypothetical protein CRECT_0607 [Campylobacter rectus]
MQLRKRLWLLKSWEFIQKRRKSYTLRPATKAQKIGRFNNRFIRRKQIRDQDKKQPQTTPTKPAIRVCARLRRISKDVKFTTGEPFADTVLV